MATGGQIAEFFGTLGFKINQSDIKKFDKTLDYLEKRARRFAETSLANVKVGVKISKFGFSSDFNSRLSRALRARMKVATNKGGIAPQIKVSEFDIDKQVLLRDMRNAIRYVEQNIRMNITPSMSGGAAAAGMGVSRGGGAAGAMRGAAVGSMAGSLGRGFFPGLGAAWGVSQINRQQQELYAQQMAAQSVFGSRELGQEHMEWVRRLGYDVGVNYADIAPSYTKMQAALMSSGMTAEGGQEMFKSITEFSRVMGLGTADMKGSLRAIEQMFNKGKITAEELKSQLGERMPAAIPLMAEAVTGGDSDKLFEMMEAGELRPEKHLPMFADVLYEKARQGGALEEAKMSSRAEQGRMGAAWSDFIKLLGKEGFESGQAKVFRTITEYLRQMNPLAEGFGEAWDYVGEAIRVPLGLVLDFGRGLEILSERLNVSKGSLIALSTVVGGILFPWTRMITLVSGALLVLEDFTAFLTGRGSAIGNFLKQWEESDPESYKRTIESIKSIYESISAVVETIYEGWVKIAELLEDVEVGSAFLDAVENLATRLEEIVNFLKYWTNESTEEEFVAKDKKLKKKRGVDTEPGYMAQAASWLTSSLMGGEGGLPVLSAMMSLDPPRSTREENISEMKKAGERLYNQNNTSQKNYTVTIQGSSVSEEDKESFRRIVREEQEADYEEVTENNQSPDN